MSSVIQEMAPVHEAMMNWVLENPEKGLREMSAYFGYTMPWLSRVINSDIFQHALRQRQDAIFTRIADDIPTKLRGLADVAIEKLGAKLEASEDPRFIRESFDSVMEHMGIKPGSVPAISQQNNVFVLPAADLQRLRSTITEQAHDVIPFPNGSGYQGPESRGSGYPGLPAPHAGALPAPSGVQAGDLPLGRPMAQGQATLHSSGALPLAGKDARDSV